jgi:hypothetical protein
MDVSRGICKCYCSVLRVIETIPQSYSVCCRLLRYISKWLTSGFVWWNRAVTAVIRVANLLDMAGRCLCVVHVQAEENGRHVFPERRIEPTCYDESMRPSRTFEGP